MSQGNTYRTGQLADCLAKPVRIWAKHPKIAQREALKCTGPSAIHTCLANGCEPLGSSPSRRIGDLNKSPAIDLRYDYREFGEGQSRGRNQTGVPSIEITDKAKA
jgi:hypothetical protein